ncbi:MAG: hypothetical protein AB7K37_04150 [Cyclobacteriaceae bacterium]
MMSQKRYDRLSQEVIHTLCYFDLFDYPLTSPEVYYFLQSNHVTAADVERMLVDLSSRGSVFRFGDYFLLRGDRSLVARRIKGNKEAKRWMVKAEKMARLIHRFPFVRSVMVSGSLSKGYMDEHCDLDFFIVTASGRLWIARTLLALYKRLFLGGSHKLFCINYFVDEDALAIEETNIFTATELATLKPLTGTAYFPKLISANPWMHRFLPNCRPATSNSSNDGEIPIKRLIERAINGIRPMFWNQWFMKMTLNRWRRLYGELDQKDFDLAFKTRPDVSKNHPRQFQKRVLALYQQRKERFQQSDQAAS